MHKVIKISLAVISSPIIIIMLLAIALYLPPVQKWAVQTASRQASESLGMDITVERVRLAFPLNLSIEEVKALRRNDSLPQLKDTVAYVRRAVLNVQMLPLFKQNVNINTLELLGTKLNTVDFVPQARVKGRLQRLELTGGTPVANVNLAESGVRLHSVTLYGADLDIALTDSVPEDTTTTENKWQIDVERLHIGGSNIVLHTPGDSARIGVSLPDLTVSGGFFDLYKGLYRVAHCDMRKGGLLYDNTFAQRTSDMVFDPNHVALSDISLKMDSLQYRDRSLELAIRNLQMRERCGIELTSLALNLSLDSLKVDANGSLQTAWSKMVMNISMPFAAISQDGGGQEIKDVVKAKVDASIGARDIKLLLADNAQLSKDWPLHPLYVKADMEGSTRSVLIPQMTVEMPTVFTLTASGNAKNFMDLGNNPYARDFKAALHTDLYTYNIRELPLSALKGLSLPATHTVADIKANGADYDVRLLATEGRGSLKANVGMNIARMAYGGDLAVTNLNVGRFVKGKGLGRFTGKATFSGMGTDILAKSTRLKTKAAIQRFEYSGHNLNNIKADILLKNGRAYADINADNKLIDGRINLDALLNPRKLNATLITELNTLDLYAFGMTKQPLNVSVCTHLDLMSDFAASHSVDGMMGDIYLKDTARIYHPDDIIMDVKTNRDTTFANVECGDFSLRLNAKGGYKRLIGAADRLTKVIQRQIEQRTIDQQELRKALPMMSMSLRASKENPIYRFIKYFDVDYDRVDVKMSTSEHEGVTANVLVDGLATKGYRLDTIRLKVNSSADPHAIRYNGYVRNVKPNDYVFAVDFDGNVLEHGISMNSTFHDADGVKGLQMGVEAEMVEDGIRFRLTPEKPLIAYEQFRLVGDNYILLNRNSRVFADVNLISDSGMGIQIYSTVNENDGDDADGEETEEQMQNITLALTNIDLGRLLSAIPYAPKVQGVMSGDLHFVQEKDMSFSISSSIQTKQLVYEGCNVGNLGADLIYMPKADGTHYIDGRLALDEKEIGTLTGQYNFDTKIIDADLAMERFPMQIVNGFIPDQIIGLEGFADGTLSVRGTTSKPDVNGELYLESSSLISTPYNIRMRFDDDPIRIVDSKLLFEMFQMYASNNQPLTSTGYLDFSDPQHMKMDLRMRAENFLLIDSKETRHSDVYGKAYVNFYAVIMGELDKLQVGGKLDILPTTNFYYILRDSPLSNDNRLKELVTFMDFKADKLEEEAKPTVDGLNISMNINVMNGSHIKCWLNDARNNYLDIIGEGDLRMRYVNDNMSMTGRYTISEGEIKYSLPVIPLKTFTVSNGSYIEFNGDVMNPKLNITAKETKKAAVNVDGTNRMVTFNTGLILTKTLNDMGLEFIIEAPEDNTITDELNMMSKEERAKQAVTMLTTGMYLAGGNTSSFSMNSALNSFLQSEISSIAGSALKTLDLSFGMDNSTEEDGTVHTNYSFKFAKRFWNNRLSISVGGKVSTGDDVTGKNKSFFDNVEVQYRLTDVSNKYMRLFYNRSVYDFLTGYVGQYGAGFLWKKKMQNLNEIFKPVKNTAPQKQKTEPAVKE